MQAILNAYARRIKRGTITFDDIPESIRDEVRMIVDPDFYTSEEVVSELISMVDISD